MGIHSSLKPNVFLKDVNTVWFASQLSVPCCVFDTVRCCFGLWSVLGSYWLHSPGQGGAGTLACVFCCLDGTSVAWENSEA